MRKFVSMGMLLLVVTAVKTDGSQDSLRVADFDGQLVEKFALKNIKRITFTSNDELLLKIDDAGWDLDIPITFSVAASVTFATTSLDCNNSSVARRSSQNSGRVQKVSRIGTNWNINMVLPRKGSVRISIRDLHGRTIRNIVSRQTDARQFTTVWDGADSKGLRVAAGRYVVHALLDDQTIAVQSIMVD